jgi:hypothetical protein
VAADEDTSNDDDDDEEEARANIEVLEDEEDEDASGAVRGVVDATWLELEVDVMELVEVEVVHENGGCCWSAAATVWSKKTSRSPKCLTGDHSL